MHFLYKIIFMLDIDFGEHTFFSSCYGQVQKHCPSKKSLVTLETGSSCF